MLVWHQGQVRDQSSVRVDLDDVTFEHGLGLFETFRSWNFKAPLLHEHRKRIQHSAQILGLSPLAEFDLPTEQDVRTLLAAEQIPEALLRLTRTGGAPGHPPVVWLRASTLSELPGASGMILVESPWRVHRRDLLAQHKSLNYWQRRRAYEHARSQGGDEALLIDDAGSPWEGSRTNLFLVVNGQLLTPPVHGPIVPGIMRAMVIATAKEQAIIVNEQVLRPEDFARAEQVFLTNSVRMILPVREIRGSFAWTETRPSDFTQRLRISVCEHLGVEA